MKKYYNLFVDMLHALISISLSLAAIEKGIRHKKDDPAIQDDDATPTDFVLDDKPTRSGWKAKYGAKKWSDEEIKLLKICVEKGYPLQKIEKVFLRNNFKRTWKAIHNKKSMLGI